MDKEHQRECSSCDSFVEMWTSIMIAKNREKLPSSTNVRNTIGMYARVKISGFTSL